MVKRKREKAALRQNDDTLHENLTTVTTALLDEFHTRGFDVTMDDTAPLALEQASWPEVDAAMGNLPVMAVGIKIGHLTDDGRYFMCPWSHGDVDNRPAVTYQGTKGLANVFGILTDRGVMKDSDHIRRQAENTVGWHSSTKVAQALTYAHEQEIAGIPCRIVFGISRPCVKKIGAGCVTRYRCRHYWVNRVFVVLSNTLPPHVPTH